ncbi:MAG: DMT family transporter [Deltaproteobacteria bacterium]|nr:DMT family transporter [Deltaproteobacteria bacterium]
MKRFSENGTLLLVVSSVFFTAMALLARRAMCDLPPAEVTFFRSAIGAVICAASFAAGAASLELKRPPMLVLRALLGGIAIFLYFKTMGVLGAGEATLLNNTFVVFVAILSPLILKERFSWRLGAVVAVAFFGVALLIRADMSGGIAGKLFGLAGALFTALAVLTIRNLRRDHGTLTVFFFFSLGGMATPLSTFGDGWTVPGVWTGAILVLMGLCAAAGQLLFTHSLRFSRAIESSVFSQLTVVWTYAAEIALWDVRLSVLTGIGALTVLAACTYLGAAFEREGPPHGPVV